jgi:SWIB/MDM2 domain
MSASFIRSSRTKSLLIDFLLTTVCLSHGDNPRVVAARRVGDNHHADKRNVRADENLLEVFDGKKVVSMFEMTKLVNGHLV